MKVSSQASTDTLGARVFYDRLRRRCDPLFQRLLTTMLFRMLGGFEIVSRVAPTSNCDYDDPSTDVSVRLSWLMFDQPKLDVSSLEKIIGFDVETNSGILLRNVNRWSKDAQRNVKENWRYVRARGKREKARMREASKLKWAVLDGRFKLLLLAYRLVSNVVEYRW